jgi:hypothetical protein
MVELPDGRLVIGGAGLVKAAGTAVAGLAVRDPRSGSWQALATFKTSTGRVATITALAVDASRTTLYVAGNFTTITKGSRRVTAVGLAQLNLKTGLWSKVG